MINLISIATYFALGMVNAFFFYKLLTLFVSPKKNIILQIISFFGMFIVVATVIFPGDMVNVTGVLLCFLFIVIFCFEDSLIQRISAVFILFPLVIALNFLTENLGLKTFLALGGVLQENMGNASFDASKYAIYDRLVHLFYDSLRVGFWFLIYRLFRHRLPNVKKLLTSAMWGVLSVICLAPLTGIISLIFFTPEHAVLIYPAMFSAVITVLGIMLLTAHIADTTVTQMENNNLRLQEVYYKELEENQKETGKLRHDMNNHLNVIATFIADGEREKAQSYYNSLSNELRATSREFCKNSIVNAVINTKYNKGMELEIDCFFSINLGNILSIDDISLCSIFANTLDNAIHACQGIPDTSKRSISVKARQSGDYFSYEITNSKANDIVEKNGIIKTSKKDQKNHGYGLSSLRSIVENYNGVLDISYTERKFTVTILILL